MALVASFLHSLCKAGLLFLGGFCGRRVGKPMWDSVLDWLGESGRGLPGLAAAVEATENAAAGGKGCRNDVHRWCSDSHDPGAGVTNIFRILQFTCLGG